MNGKVDCFSHKSQQSQKKSESVVNEAQKQNERQRNEPPRVRQGMMKLESEQEGEREEQGMGYQRLQRLPHSPPGEFILEVEEIRKLRESLTRVYVQRTGKPLWVVSEDMERDVFMSATEAQAHEIVDTTEVATPTTTPTNENVELLEDNVVTLEGYYHDAKAQKNLMEWTIDNVVTPKCGCRNTGY
ncbi:hypothetical protein Goshw_001247 [Gossypium schwendimanii]|uniref:Uncharacterized protein n=1 Tax=Gossypium schwendimanii TaxID=34291 RepID=A0A7J9L6U3_GOSSC|nr:hypothetical protein [Gossypium schwendimanii]